MNHGPFHPHQRVRVVRDTMHRREAPVGSTGFIAEVNHRFSDGTVVGYMVHIDRYRYALFGFNHQDLEAIND